MFRKESKLLSACLQVYNFLDSLDKSVCLFVRNAIEFDLKCASRFLLWILVLFFYVFSLA